MTKLINAFRKLPSPSNRAKIERYLARHMVAICLLADEDRAFLKVHGFSV